MKLAPVLVFSCKHPLRNLFYKITKIVRALWLAERSVCMRVCKHGCGVKLFGFSCPNHASMNLKKFSSSKLNKFTLFTHSFVGWNLENRYKESVSIFFFCLSWHFKREKSVFWKASLCKTRTDYACKTSGTRLLRISLLISAIQRVVFFLGKFIYKSNRKLFSCICIAWYKHLRHWENSQQLCKPLTSSRVCITVSNSPNPSRVYIRLCKHGKRFLLLKSNTMQKKVWITICFWARTAHLHLRSTKPTFCPLVKSKC